MSTSPPTQTADDFRQDTSRSDLALRPEHILVEVEKLFSDTPADRFGHAAISFATAATGSRYGFLYEVQGTQPAIKAFAAPQGIKAFTAQQQVDLIAANAIAKQSSQRASISLETTQYFLICVPFTITGQRPQAMALILGPERAAHIEPAFTFLHMVTQLFVRRAFGAHSQQLQSGFNQATLLVDLYSRVAHCSEFREAIGVICNEVHELVGCSRVAVGLGDQHRCKVYGLSGTGSLDNTSQATTLLASAMREAIGVDSPTVWPDTPLLRDALTSASQQQLLETFGAEVVLTVPLETKDMAGGNSEIIGAWSFIWTEKDHLTPQKLELVSAATPHTASLIQLSRQSLPTGLTGAVRRFQKSASRSRKMFALLAPILFVGAMLLPFPHRVGADCRLQAKQTRQVAAPFNGLLEQALVRPGDEVEEGQLLAILDGKEINWRLAEAIARLEASLKERDQAMAKRDVAAKQLAQLQADSLALEVELLRYQRDNLEIRAPLAGTVLSGNLERSQGVPVMTGQKLFDIGPMDELELELSVPDAEISRVKEGQKVHFRLESQTRFRYESVIDEVYPVSEIQDEKNVFIGLAPVSNPEGELRPGMLGKARIVSGIRPLGWILFHRLWESIQLQLW